MKRRTVIILISAITLFAVIMLLAAALSGLTLYAAAKKGVNLVEEQFSQAHAYEVNWNIDLPDGIHELYSIGTPASFHGDGDQYNVYDTEGVDGIEEFLAGFSSGHDADMEEDVMDILLSLDADYVRFSLDLDGDIVWRRLMHEDNSILYMIYDVNTGMLHMVERLI